MKEIKAFLQSVAEGNQEDAKEHFGSAIGVKVSAALNARKVAVAQKHFNEETLEEAAKVDMKKLESDIAGKNEHGEMPIKVDVRKV